MENVLVFGGEGQLGQALQKVTAAPNTSFHYHFLGSGEGNVLQHENLKTLFDKYKPVYIINCAAYTAVDKAEENRELAFAINSEGARNLALLCAQYGSCMIQVSTDFVFDGRKNSPYNENDVPQPLGVYGLSKLKGEEAIRESGCDYFIIRTSWLYSEFGHNFLKTMLRLASTKTNIAVVADQRGTPTYAVDLAEFIVYLVLEKIKGKEIYHFSNEGEASWYEFAVEIFNLAQMEVAVAPIATEKFPTLAKRPAYSVLGKEKLKRDFNYPIPHWKDSLGRCLKI